MWWLSGKEATCQCRRCGFDPWVGKIPWQRKWQPTLVSLPGKSHGQRNLVGDGPWDCKRAGNDLVTIQQQAGIRGRIPLGQYLCTFLHVSGSFSSEEILVSSQGDISLAPCILGGKQGKRDGVSQYGTSLLVSGILEPQARTCLRDNF